MPPTLRSAQSSPAGKDPRFNASPGLTPGRKAPTCTKCGQPRLGHPRSACPDKDVDTSPTKVAGSKTSQDKLSQVFGSMYLETSIDPTEQLEPHGHPNRRSVKTPPLQTSETLASISTSADDMLQDLTKPGFFSQATAAGDDDNKGSREHGRVAYAHTPSKLKIKSGPQRLMPGTLMAPSWESSIGRLPDDMDTSDSPKKTSFPKRSLGIQTSFQDLGSSTSPSPLSNSQSSAPSSQAFVAPRRLQKSQTQEQRELFLSSLSQASPATVYIHKKEGVNMVVASAQAAKLHVRIVKNDDKDDEDVLLVIGSEYRAVEKLADELASSVVDAAPGTTTNNYYITKSPDEQSSSSTLRALASGAIVGAVGTWAGLAFS